MTEKRILPAFLLCFFFGVLGIHRFYVGKIGTGILQIVTLGGLGIWALIDLIMIIVGAFTDKEGNKLTQWT
jgi:TM2 domain-containing membrane protein YozV